MKLTRKTAFVILAVFTLPGCQKKDDTKFVISVNNTPRRLSETAVRATYYPEANFLRITALEGLYMYMGIYLDGAAPLNTYPFEANGSNAASIQPSGNAQVFMSDNNVADAGGSLSITAFDTVQKKLSCNFLVNCYAADRVSKTIISSTLSNLSFTTDTLKYHGNMMKCTVNGVKTTNWQTKTGAFLGCPNIGLSFKFTTTSVPRGLYFNIPFRLGTGSFPIQAGAFGTGCSSEKVVATYVADSVYQFTSGTINITRMDVAQKKMEANFNLDAKDSRGDRLQFANSSFVINMWKDE